MMLPRALVVALLVVGETRASGASGLGNSVLRRRHGSAGDDARPLRPTPEAWARCIDANEGCTYFAETNDAHAFPYLASFLSVVFIGTTGFFFYLVGDSYQQLFVRIRPGVGG
ncbi:hypothetical protein M885DRAFT_621308 [Pelagophyceae sp. CCMP2097]|nr:hypothetical protein M885DRAFT_621308 [Pelagophyceae sp. CCMP2097]